MKRKNVEKRESSLTIRAFVVYLCVVLASAGIIYRIIDLQFFRDDLKIQQTEMVEIPVERGVIVSQHGEILVQRSPKYKIAMDMYPTERIKGEKDTIRIKVLLSDEVFDNQVTALADSLTVLFGETTPSWEQKLKTARADKKRYFIISDNAGVSEYNRVRKFPILCMKEYNALCNPEIDFNNVKYFYGNLAHRTLGNVREYIVKNKDGSDSIVHENIGLEGYFDKELSGTPGRTLRKYVSNIAVDVKSNENINPCDGYNIKTTLDMTIQDIANSALAKSLDEFNADEGCVIVMEVATGDILAMVNLRKSESGEYHDDKNIALTQYEPGSTFKTAGLLVALNDGKVTPNTPIPLNYISGRKAKVGYREITDDHALPMNNPELWYVLAQSSNVGTARTIYDRYASQQQEFIDGLYKLGFGDTIHFPVFGGDRTPLLRDTSHPIWSKLSLSTIPWGYELEVTPLHLLTFYNAIANNGCMVKPRLVTEIFSKDSTICQYEVDTMRAQICSVQALQDIRGMLDSVVTCGTARRGFMDAPYSVAGKTGTSKIHSPDAKGENLYNASFCGYFPADNPKYSCIVVIKKPRAKSIYGGAVALPVFRDIADKIFYSKDYGLMPEATAISPNADLASIPITAKLRSATLATIFKGICFNTAVPQVSEWVKIYSDGQQLHIDEVTFLRKNIVPDVRNMSLTDAVYILEKVGIAAEIQGFGRVKKQTPEANAPLPKNKKVILELNIES